MLPACLLPLPGPRRARLVTAVVGVVCGASMFVGGALARFPAVVTAIALVALVLSTAVAAFSPRDHIHGFTVCDSGGTDA